MWLRAIDAFSTADVGIVQSEAGSLVTDRSRPWEGDVRRRQRSDASVMVSSGARPGSWHTVIKCPTGAAADAVLAALDGDPKAERRLALVRGSTNVVGYAAVRQIERHGDTDLVVVFEPTYSLVEDETPTTTSKTFSSVLDQAVLVTVPGNQRTAPVVRIQPTVQRAAPTAAVGWKYRTRWTLTNNASESLYRYPVRISLGDTTPLTTTKAQADGDDLRVWIGGKEVARDLVTWDTAASFVWFLIPALAPGASLVAEIVYGNVNAVAPPVLAYPDLPPFALATSTNAQWVYQVSTIAGNAGKGGWNLSSGTSNPTTDQETPGSWRNVLTFENPDNTDDCNNRKVTVYTDSGTKYIGIFNATRARGGAMDLLDEGLADGVTIHNPLGISSVEVEIIYENDAMAGSGSNPIGKFVILTRDSGAEIWNILFSDNSTDNTPVVIATATYTPAAAVKHLAFAVWPFDEDLGEVNQKAKNARKVNAQWDDVLNLNIASSNLTITQTESEVEIYELATEVRHGGHAGGTVANPPYEVVRIGNALAASGAGTLHAACKLNEIVIVDCAARTHEVWNSGLTARVEDLPVPTVLAWDGRDDAGITNEYPAVEWLPLQAVASPLTNGDFTGSVSPWAAINIHANATIGTLLATGNELNVPVLTNTAGSGATVADIVPGQRIPINGRARIQVAGTVSTDKATVVPRMTFLWYTSGGSFISASVEAAWTPVVSTDYRRDFSAVPPATAATFDVGMSIVNGGASPGAANLTLDAVRADGVDLMVTDVAMGTLVVNVLTAGRYVP